MTFDRLPFIIDQDPEAHRAPADAERAVALAESYLIESQRDAQDAADTLAKLKEQRRAIEDKRKHLKEPYLEGGRRVDEFFAAPLERLAHAIRTLDGAIVGWHRAETARIERERRAAEAEARAAAEAAAARAREAEAAAEAAAAVGNEERALEMEANYQEAMQEAQAALAAPAAVLQPLPKVEGATIRGTWKARLINKAALIRAAGAQEHLHGLLQFDTAAANAMARATKGATKVPGIEFYQSVSTTTRRTTA